MTGRWNSRRGFLSGLPRTRTLEDLGLRGGSSPATPATLKPRGNGVLHVSRPAMACEFTVYTRLDSWDGPERNRATNAAMVALDAIEREEARLSVYKPFSEINVVNRFAAKRPMVVDDALFALLSRAMTLSEQTGGAFDITTGPLTRAWGFYRREGRFPSDDELAAALANVGWRNVRLDPKTPSITFDRAGVEINLGAIGKGYALDVALAGLTAAGSTNVLFQGGRSSLVARGDQTPPVPSRRNTAATGSELAKTGTASAVGEQTSAEQRLGWVIAVMHPLRPDRPLGEIRLIDEAAGTSGGGFQSFFHQGKRYSHIIDPRTGRPAEEVISVTAIAPDAATADALSTAFYVLGPVATEAFLVDRPDLGALLLTLRPGGTGVEIHTFGCLADRWNQTGEI